MVLCTSLPVAGLWQSENWSFPHPPAQGSHRCPASHTSLSPDWATTPVHLTPPSPCQTIPVTAALSPATNPSKMSQPHPPPCSNRQRNLPLAPTGGLCLLEVSPLQCHHSKGGQAQRKAVTYGNMEGRVSRAWPSYVLAQKTQGIGAHNTAAAATETSARESSS